MASVEDFIKPIDDAPKDGTWVLVFCVSDHKGVIVGGKVISEPDPVMRVLWASMAFYVIPRVGDKGYWSDGVERLVPPTHWMYPPFGK